MVCKLLFFDYRDFEKSFFEKTKLENFEIIFFEMPLNEDTVSTLSSYDKNNTAVISVYKNSSVTKKVIDNFRNLRIISTRSSECSHIDVRACIDKNIALVNVELPWADYENYALLQTFKSITGVLCGCKEYRVV